MEMQNTETKYSILIVDDDEEIRLGFHHLLSAKGFIVEVAASGAQALRAYKDSGFDLVITDILMPNEDGLSLIMQLRGYDKEVRIIAISGGGKKNNMGYLKLARSFGAITSLEKPVTSVKLLEAINEILGIGGIKNDQISI